MAIAASRVTVGTTATALVDNTGEDAGRSESSDAASQRVRLKNATATASVFLGASGVTTAAGFEWATADGSLTIDVEPGEVLYGIVAAGTQTVHVLTMGR